MNERITRRMALAGLVAALCGGSWIRQAAAGGREPVAREVTTERPRERRLLQVTFDPGEWVASYSYDAEGTLLHVRGPAPRKSP